MVCPLRACTPYFFLMSSISLFLLSGCLYQGRERANGEMWDDSSDPCAACVCLEGSVKCKKKRCPPSNCKHPVQRQCCMSCDGELLTREQHLSGKVSQILKKLTSYFHVFRAGCMFRGKEYPDGTEFPEDNDPCGVCNCYGGEVVCTKTPCYGDCSHPYKPPGQCCGECERV